MTEVDQTILDQDQVFDVHQPKPSTPTGRCQDKHPIVASIIEEKDRLQESRRAANITIERIDCPEPVSEDSADDELSQGIFEIQRDQLRRDCVSLATSASNAINAQDDRMQDVCADCPLGPIPGFQVDKNGTASDMYICSSTTANQP